MQAKRIAVIVVAGLACAILVGLAWYHGLARVERGENAPSVKWLPRGATNVSFYRSYLFTAYEFDIDERGFREWVKPYEIQPIEGEFQIGRYNLLDSLSEMRGLPEDSEAFAEARERHKKSSYKVLTNGYKHETRFGDSGGGRYIAYDLDTGRAFYQYNPR